MAEAADSAFDHAQSCSDGQEGRLSLRDHCATGYAVGLRRMGASAAISLMQLAVSSLLRVVWEISDFFTMHARAPIPVYILGRFYSYTNIHYTPTLQNIHYTTYIPTLSLLGNFNINLPSSRQSHPRMPNAPVYTQGNCKAAGGGTIATPYVSKPAFHLHASMPVESKPLCYLC